MKSALVVFLLLAISLSASARKSPCLVNLTTPNYTVMVESSPGLCTISPLP